ncbi:hypothetical protein [Peribacillus frigoritolerans]|uniref:hypothetical protein n=1 Tax=Peribacillus frigoritolerans TaxID=450367 RepID=UPI003D9EBA86
MCVRYPGYSSAPQGLFFRRPETLTAATSATTAAPSATTAAPSATSASTTASTATAATKATEAQETAKTTKAAHTNELPGRIIQTILVLLPRNWLSHLEIIDIQILQLILKFIHFI